MEMIQTLKDRYDSYIREVETVMKDAKPTDGLFGWGDDPRRDPCHMRFYEDLEHWCRDFLDGAPAQGQVYEAVKFILETPDKYRQKACFWFMFAAQGLTRPMIPLLSDAQRKALRELYDGCYPKRERMPVQAEVYRLLKKGEGRKRSWLF